MSVLATKPFGAQCGMCGKDWYFDAKEERLGWLHEHDFKHLDYVSFLRQPIRIQRKRTKGWKMPDGAVYVGRPTAWGNPFPIAEHGAKLSLALYRNVLNGLWSPIVLQDLSDEDYARVYEARNAFLKRLGHRYHPSEMLHELRGKDLACWCEIGAPCHGDILIELANRGGA